MVYRKSILLICSIILAVSGTLADVPPPRLHRPDIPYFMESMRFQTVEMRIFAPEVSGMVMDPYSDLHWNPALVLSETETSLYLDFNPQVDIPAFAFPMFTLYRSYYRYSTEYMVLPRWYPNTSVNTVDTRPLYNVAGLAALTPRLSIGFINRSLFDYGPFRSAYRQYYGFRADFALGASFPAELEPERLEVDNNQQKVIGTQSEFLVGFKLSEKLDLGLRLGHYVYDREGTLYNSKWATYPHSSFANLDDESLDISGNHVETGIGLMYRLSDNTLLGIYGGFLNGNGTEKIASLDTADSWWERDTNPDYYRISEYLMDSEESYSSSGKRRNLTLTLERHVSPNFTFRSFLSASWRKSDISGSVASSDTSYGDRGGEVWDWRTDREYDRRESHSSREGGLSGSGDENENRWKLFASLIYAPGESWSAFGGIQVRYHTIDRSFDETSDYMSHSWEKYTVPGSVEYRYHYTHDKIYTVKENHKKWSVFLPIAVKAKVVSGLFVILGTDLSLTLTDENSEGRLLYPERMTRRWENGTLTVEDIETDRYEEYRSDPAKGFSRSIEQRFGLVYEHPTGAKLFVRSLGDILHTANWALGFEIAF